VAESRTRLQAAMCIGDELHGDAQSSGWCIQMFGST